MGSLLKTKKAICIISVVLIALVTGVVLACITPFPELDTISTKAPNYFRISKPNIFEEQGKNQCSAFSTAYVLRYFNQESKGSEVYKNITYKIPISGYVLPKGILNFFRNYKLNVKLLKGNINTLKSQVSKGVPVIVLTGKNISWQHYMTVVGYNTENKEIYLFDSKRQTDENKEQPGNRTLNEDYFLTLWDNGLPFFLIMYTLL